MDDGSCGSRDHLLGRVLGLIATVLAVLRRRSVRPAPPTKVVVEIIVRTNPADHSPADREKAIG